jgi:hypothetical protein
MRKVDQRPANTRLRAAMQDLRETSALLRAKATNLALGKRKGRPAAALSSDPLIRYGAGQSSLSSTVPVLACGAASGVNA